MRYAPGPSNVAPGRLPGHIRLAPSRNRGTGIGNGLLIAVGFSLMLWAALAQIARWAAHAIF